MNRSSRLRAIPTLISTSALIIAPIVVSGTQGSPIANATTVTSVNGGTIVDSGTFRYHTFTHTGTVGTSTTDALVVTGGTLTNVEVLLVGGGGGGGRNRAGGGGAGGITLLTNQTIPSGSTTVTVGGGGAGGWPADNGWSDAEFSPGCDGLGSSFGATSVGGGGGGGANSTRPTTVMRSCINGSEVTGAAKTAAINGSGGASGGGGAYTGGTGGAASASGSGHPGGDGPANEAGGGGGAGSAGVTATTDSVASGGAGLSTHSEWGAATSTGEDISGTRWFGGGGGGFGPSLGGYGGGGDAKGAVFTAYDGLATSGGGGGACASASTGCRGGHGGSGVVIVRYPIPTWPTDPAITSVTASGTTVSITWTAANDNGVAITGHEIAYRMVGDSDWTVVADTDGNPTDAQATVTGVPSGRCPSMEFRIRAINGNGMSAATTTSEPSTVTGYPTPFDETHAVLSGLGTASSGGAWRPTITGTGATAAITLTQASGGQGGFLWNQQRIDLSESFCVQADVNLGSSNAGADGLAFVIQPNSTASGSSGGGLGYFGISPSFAIEFDTHQNSSDPSGDHVGLMKDGDTSHSTPGWGAVPVEVSNLEDGNWRTMQFMWDSSTRRVTVRVDIDRSGSFDSGETIFNAVAADLADHFSAENGLVYWGFTAATGGAVNLQQVRNISHRGAIRANQAPTISLVPANQEHAESEAATVDFVLGDDRTTQAQWSFAVAVSNSAIFSSQPTATAVSATTARVAYTTSSGAGPSTVTITATDADGASVTTSFTVLKRTGQTVTIADPGPLTYGDQPFTPAVTSTTTATISASPERVCSAAGNIVSINGAGTCTITADAPTSGLITSASGTRTVTIGRATATMTAPSPTITYGAPVPNLVPSTQSLVNGDAVADIDGLSCTTTYSTGDDVGTYPVTCLDTSTDYTITHVAGELTVAKAQQSTLSIAADQDDLPSGTAAVFGQTVTLNTSGGSGSGELSFSIGSSNACTVATSDGVTTVTITAGTGTCTVSARKAADDNHLAGDASITIPVGPAQLRRPGAPAVTVIDDTTIQVAIPSVTGATAYTVTVSAGSTVVSTITVPASTATVVFRELAPGTEYDVTVRADSGSDNWSDSDDSPVTATALPAPNSATTEPTRLVTTSPPSGSPTIATPQLGEQAARDPGQAGAVLDGDFSSISVASAVTEDTTRAAALTNPSERTPEQIEVLRDAARQILEDLDRFRPNGATLPLTVVETETGASILGAIVDPQNPARMIDIPVENVVLLTGSESALLLAAIDSVGEPVGLSPDGVLEVVGGAIGTTAFGFDPSILGEVVLFSDPRLLATFTTDPSGTFVGQFSMPSDIEPGDHTLVFATGSMTKFLGIRIAPPERTLPNTGADTDGVLPWLILLTALGGFVWISSTGRDRSRRTLA